MIPNGWRRYPIRAKLCCYLLCFLVLSLSTQFVLGHLFNQSMDMVDKQLQDYYNITAFSDAFTSADYELEQIVRRGSGQQDRLRAFAQLRTEADGYLAALTGSLSTRNRERYLLVSAVASSYDAYMEEADAILACLIRGESGELGHRYFGTSSVISDYMQKYIPELLTHEISSGRAMYAESRGRINRLFLGGIAVFAVVHISTVFLLMYLIRQSFFEPVRKIAEAMKHIGEGDFEKPDIPVQEEGGDELAQLVTVFNLMKQSTRERVAALREKNELEHELHLQAEESTQIRRQLELARYAKLRSQVKPHFLFNTLNIISRVAREEHAADTERLIVSLARLFRYSLNTDAPYVSLAREIKCVDDYMRIQNIRFGDRLRFSWRIDPQLDPEAVSIVPYTLQPFVENAVLHGLRDTTEDGKIRITLRSSPQGLLVYITDNGRGMGKEQLALLREFIPPKDDSHIGIYNVRCRLLHFRPESRLQIYSYDGYGTCVKMLIPQEEGTC